MRSFDDGSASQAPNAFNPFFLTRFGERDEPPTGGEADVAGPWFVEEIPGVGFGLFRAGESLERGFHPAAVFPDRWLALVVAAVLPGTGRDPLFRLEEAGTAGYDVVLEDSTAVDEPLLDAMNIVVGLARSPWSLAYLLEAAGPLALERCGALLDQRVFAERLE